jgi:hypothetical protein
MGSSREGLDLGFLCVSLTFSTLKIPPLLHMAGGSLI